LMVDRKWLADGQTDAIDPLREVGDGIR